MTSPELAWTSFEDEVYEAVKNAVATGLLPFSRKNVKVVRRASYRSPVTNDTINLEVAIEAYREGASEPFMLWLWECKHKASRKVEVGEIRELHSKIQELGVSRTTGAVVTRIGFQSGAVQLAQQLGISLYLLQKRLVPIMKYSCGAADEEREVVYSSMSSDIHGITRDETPFADLVCLFVRQGVERLPN